MAERVKPLRRYVCADCGGTVLRGPGGIVYRHQQSGVDHAPRKPA